MLRGTLPPISNRESLIDDIEFIDPDDNTLWDLTGVTAKIELKLVGSPYQFRGYLPYLGYAAYNPICLLATTENGAIVFDSSQSMKFTFTETQIATLPSGQYHLSGTVTRDNETIQIFQFDMPILDGDVLS